MEETSTVDRSDAATVHPSEMSSSIEEIVKQVAETIQREANVRTIFGDPVQIDQHKVIPVSQVMVSIGGGLGMGRGTGPVSDPATANEPAKYKGQSTGMGGGGGGGIDIKVVPLGFIHEQEGRAAFSPISAQPEGLLGRIEDSIRATLKR